MMRNILILALICLQSLQDSSSNRSILKTLYNQRYPLILSDGGNRITGSETHSFVELVKSHCVILEEIIDSPISVYFRSDIGLVSSNPDFYVVYESSSQSDLVQDSEMMKPFVIERFTIRHEWTDVGLLEIRLLGEECLTNKNRNIANLVANSIGSSVITSLSNIDEKQTTARDEMILETLSSIQTLSKMLRRRLPKQDEVALETVDNILVQSAFAWDLITRPQLAAGSMIENFSSSIATEGSIFPALGSSDWRSSSSSSNSTVSSDNKGVSTSLSSTAMSPVDPNIFFDNAKHENTIYLSPLADNNGPIEDSKARTPPP